MPDILCVDHAAAKSKSTSVTISLLQYHVFALVMAFGLGNAHSFAFSPAPLAAAAAPLVSLGVAAARVHVVPSTVEFVASAAAPTVVSALHPLFVLQVAHVRVPAAAELVVAPLLAALAAAVAPANVDVRAPNSRPSAMPA